MCQTIRVVSHISTPANPKVYHQSLPPMLSKQLNTSIPSCSEASRGLSVLPQGGGIFTDIAISPGPSLRQFPSRDAIRAGLNLPDKEFRYHRTVHYCYYLTHVNGRTVWIFLPHSACRHADRTISSVHLLWCHGLACSL